MIDAATLIKDMPYVTIESTTGHMFNRVKIVEYLDDSLIFLDGNGWRTEMWFEGIENIDLTNQ